MKTKGFTLVELLAVIAILGIIALIVSPTLIGVVNKSKKDIKEEQIAALENAASRWTLSNEECLYNHVGAFNLSFDALKQSGLITTKEVIDPTTNNELVGCIAITWSDTVNQYLTEYTESCTTINTCETGI
ncbi:MAG: prepilin-type N-terminal cleavage/methylation domain-containing protein [Ignavibacteriales bacterium]